MSRRHFKRGLFVLLFVGTAIAVAHGATTAQAPEAVKRDEKVTFEFLDAPAPPVLPGDSESRKLLKQRVNVAVNECRLRKAEFEQGRGTLSLVLESCDRLFEARLALADNVVLEVNLRRQFIEYIGQIEKSINTRFEVGGIRHEWLLRTQYAHVDAIARLGKLRDSLPGADFALPNVSIADPASGSEVHLPPLLNVVFQSIGANEPDPQRSLKLCANLAAAEMHLHWAAFVSGRGLVEDYRDCARRLRNSHWDLATEAAERQEILSRNLRIHQAAFDRFKGDLGCMKPGASEGFLYYIHNAKSELLRSIPDRQSPGKLPSVIVALPPPDVPNDPQDGLDPDQNEPAFTVPKLFTVRETEPELQSLCKERFNTSHRAARFRYREYRTGRGTLDELLHWSHRARNAQLEAAGDPKKRIAILTEYRDFMKTIEELNQSRFKVGALKQQDLEQTRYERLTAEIDLLQAKHK